jgi:medium-chain acyl-[acyl-carrier-protein] hydrolase
MTITPTLWLAYHKPNPRCRIRLFCFPYAGGGASVFIPWIGRLAPEIEVCPVQLPGRENRISEPCLRDVDEVAERAKNALTPFLDVNFAFFGHSLGALIAYETAQRVGLYGPRHLIVSGRRAPHFPRIEEPSSHLPDPDFERHLEKLKGTPREVLANRELMELLLPTVRADFRMDETYVHPVHYGKLSCPITVFGAVCDIDLPQSHLLAWNCVTQSNCHLHMFDGDHFFVLKQAKAVIDTVGQILRNEV